MPNVSVIIPTYNRAGLLAQALRSVLAQTYEDYEAVVIDDGSTDNTREVVDSVRDDRIRYIRQENKGLAGARNTGLDCARGRLMGFLDSDDVWLPNLLETLVGGHARHPEVGVVYARTGRFNDRLEFPYPLELFDEGTEEWVGNMHRELLTGASMLVLTMLVKKEMFDQAGGFATSVKYGEDWDTWLRISRLCDFCRMPQILALYRVHPGQMSNDTAGMLRESLKILNSHIPHLPSFEQQEALHMGERQLHQWYGFAAMMDGDPQGKAWLAIAQDRSCRLRDSDSVGFCLVRHGIHNVPYDNKAREQAAGRLRAAMEVLCSCGAKTTADERMGEFWAGSIHAAYRLRDAGTVLHCFRNLVSSCGLSRLDRGIRAITARSALKSLTGKGRGRITFPIERELRRIVGSDMEVSAQCATSRA